MLRMLPVPKNLSLFLLFTSTFFAVCLADCAPYPISAPIKDVRLSDKQKMRGVSLSVGTPGQEFAFLPQWPVNNTYVYGENGQCISDWSEDACITYRGGQYDTNVSQTYTAASSTVAVYDNQLDINNQSEWARDNFKLNSNLTLESFPLGIPEVDWGGSYDPQMTLGMGPNSTILSALKAAGKAGSRSWSFFWGLTGPDPKYQIPGSFVFGGYDRAKVKGDNYTQALSPDISTCKTGMLVTIADMELNFPNGTSSSLFGKSLSAAMSACIQPDFPVIMTLPYDPYYQRFDEITRGEYTGRSLGVNYYGMNYSPGTVYDGDLTISLSSGLSVRIPNYVLVNPDLIVDKHTGVRYTNNNASEVLINSAQTVNSDDLPIIGRQFFSAAYVMLNQDSNEFTLWEANPTTDEDLVAVDGNNQVVENFCGSSSSSNHTETPNNITSSHPTATSSAEDGGASIGPIAGLVVGVVVGVAMIAGLIIFLVKRRRRTPAPEPTGVPRYETYIPYPLAPPAELHDKPRLKFSGPAEMPAAYFTPADGKRPPSRRAAQGMFELF